MDLHKIFDYDDGLLLNKAGHIYCNLDKDGYIRVRTNGKEYRAHRIIWEMFNGPIPEGLLIDHIDGDKLNNRIDNLRIATRRQNRANSRAPEFAELPKGVTRLASGKYRAKLTYTFSLGTFDTPEEAAEAYNNKAIELHGEFARIDNE